MKKKTLIVLGLVAILGFGLVSCKKDCKCIGKLNGEEFINETTKTKKNDCKASYTESYMGYEVTVNCTWD